MAPASSQLLRLLLAVAADACAAAMVTRIAPVKIEVTGINSRRISSSIRVQSDMSAVWKVLTDYDRLASIVPNLVASRRVTAPRGVVRVYQEGAQSVVGLDFRASLTMDMQEIRRDALLRPLPSWTLKFSCHDSVMFQQFSGEWKLSTLPQQQGCELRYSVDITPKGAVPVPAIEWRIREDVPPNLNAIKQVCEQASRG